MEQPRILVVDDESSVRHVLRQLLTRYGCVVRDAGSGEEALRLLEEFDPQVAMVDIVLPGINGLELLTEIKKRCADTEVLVMTSHATAGTAIEALRRGAYDYLGKPFDPIGHAWAVVERALEKRALTIKNRELMERLEQRNREISTTISLMSCDAEKVESAVTEHLEYFLDVVTRELSVARASVMLVGDDNVLRIGASRGIDEIDPATVRVPLGQGVAGRVAATGEPVLIGDTRSDLAANDDFYAHLSESFLCAPIMLGDRIVGVVNITNRTDGRPFDLDDLSFARNLAGQLALTIESARQSARLQLAFEQLRSTQDQLVFSERIKAVGQMATGVAHDFNNALAVILARAEFTQRALAQPDPDIDGIRHHLDTIVATAYQGAEIIKRIQDYTRVRKDTPNEPVDVCAVIRAAAEMSRPKWQTCNQAEGRHIEVRLDLEETSLVRGNRFELTQVVSNLVFNAVEAMPWGGELTLRCWNEAEVVAFEVRDTGVGMDEETRRRLFEPFFTTKETGQGLGTSIIYGIVSRHGGAIEINSEPGVGTSFMVRLPRMTEVAPVQERHEEARPAEQLNAHILLVDDEPAIRETFTDALTLVGHTVTAAADGDEALLALSSGSCDLVITDMCLGGMTGLDLAAEIKRRRPGTPVILFSGWAVQQNADEVRAAGIDLVVVKPCSLHVILEAVQRALRDSSVCA